MLPKILVVVLISVLLAVLWVDYASPEHILIKAFDQDGDHMEIHGVKWRGTECVVMALKAAGREGTMWQLTCPTAK